MPDYPDVPALTYPEVRPLIADGDLLLCCGTARISRLIQKATNSVFSHVALLLWTRLDTLAVYESVESIGTWLVPMSHYVTDCRSTGKPYPGRLFVARHLHMGGVTPEEMHRMAHFAFSRCGKVYHREQIRTIAKIIAAPWLCDGPNVPPNYCDAKSYICSEAVAACFQQIELPIPWDPRGFVAPDDFAQTPIEICWEIRHG